MGCGSNPTGHVNVDTLRDWDENNIAQVKTFRCFVVADGMNLPFRNKAFDLVNCIMTLEHFIDPAKAMRDFAYVANRAYLVVPNNPIVKDTPSHIFSWCQESFHNFLNIFYDDIVITTGIQDIQSIDHIFIKIIMKIPLFRIPITRFISRFLALRVYAMCSSPRSRARAASGRRSTRSSIEQKRYAST